MSDARRYGEIFEYLRDPSPPAEATPTIVFGRKDPLVAQAAGDLVIARLAPVVIISGSVGKDSGDIIKLGYRSEAHYLGNQLEDYLGEVEQELSETALILLGETAKTGGDNAREFLEILDAHDYPLDPVTAVAHATSLRRLAATQEFETHEITGAVPMVHRVPSNYNFDPTLPQDQKEAAEELLRLYEWPAKNQLLEQPDLPQDLVDFARERHGNAPKRPNPYVVRALSALPVRAQSKLFGLVSRSRKK